MYKKKKKDQLPPTTWERTFLRAVTGLSWMSEPNHLFYTGRLQSVPDGNWIDQVHLEWFWDYDHLESHHGYIQWLFAIFEGQGMNFGSYRLLKEEARKMRRTLECNVRFLRSYKLMLNFYGFRIVDYETGELERTDEYEERFLNLNYCSHNNLRISRILMALGEHGFVRYKKTLLAKLTEEIKENGQMPECTESLEKFWTFLVVDEDSPQYVKKTKESPEDREEGVFFKHQKAKDRVYEKWEEDERRWTQELMQVRERMRDKFEEGKTRRMKEFERRAELFADMEKARAKARAAKQQQQNGQHNKKPAQQKKKEKDKEQSDNDDESEEEPQHNKEPAQKKKEKEQSADGEGEEEEPQHNKKPAQHKKKEKEKEQPDDGEGEEEESESESEN